MGRTLKSVTLAFIAITTCLYAQPDSEDVDALIRSQTYEKHLVILCEERDFFTAQLEAQRVSLASGVQFSMNGHVWDSKRGLILPDVCGDPVYCGEYLPRRYNELHLFMNPVGYISVEKSGAYPHLEKGYYIALAAIRDSNEEAEQELLKFKPFAPKAYIAKTEIYMGCIH